MKNRHQIEDVAEKKLEGFWNHINILARKIDFENLDESDKFCEVSP